MEIGGKNGAGADYIRCEHDGCRRKTPAEEWGKAVHGQRVQNSVFECSLDAAQLCGLKAELTKLIDEKKDSLRFYNLGNSFHTRVEHIGARSSYKPDDVLML